MPGLLVVTNRGVAAVCCLVLLAACSGEAVPTESFPAPPVKEEAGPATAVDADFYDFTASRLGGGGQVTGAELQGKDVALWFWAPW